MDEPLFRQSGTDSLGGRLGLSSATARQEPLLPGTSGSRRPQRFRHGDEGGTELAEVLSLTVSRGRYAVVFDDKLTVLNSQSNALWVRVPAVIGYNFGQ
jgi:hypothetical protein